MVNEETMKYIIKQKIKDCIIFPLLNFFEKHIPKYIFYQNINLNLNNPRQKKILISYITAPMEYKETQKIRHTNIHESIQILHTFITKGYSIDLIHCQDNKNILLLREKKYDLIFGFGEPFYQACLLNPDSFKIIYLTESEPSFSLKQETDRIKYFYKRHSIKTSVKRSKEYFKEKYIKIADFGILIGNMCTIKSYNRKLNQIYLLKSTGLMNPEYKLYSRDLQKSKKNFVWFGSSGAIHKGLDILIDVFKAMPDCTLYVCGLSALEKEELSYMKDYTNIIDLGFMDVYSSPFLDLVNNCSYVILPSCSEGMATSVLTCMNHSLIPIITKETGIDVFDFGIEIEDYHIESVIQIIKRASNLSDQQLQIMHEKVFDYAIKNFNLENFTNNFSRIIDNIVKKRNGMDV